MICRDDNLFWHQTHNYSSLDQAVLQDIIIENEIKNQYCQLSMIDAIEKPYQSLGLPLKEKCFTDTELMYLKQMYAYLYPNYIVADLDRFYNQSKNIIINNEEFVSTASRSTRSPAIAAHWPGVLDIDPNGEAPLRIGILTCFIQHKIRITPDLATPSQEISTLSHNLANVQWYMDHSHRDYLHPSIVISSTVFCNMSAASYMPVCRIAGRCAIAATSFMFDYGEDSINICVPLLKNCNCV